MAWLYVPDMEGLNSELNESLMNTKPFVMSRGKPSQPATLSKKWKKGAWMTRLSGLTLKPLKAKDGVEKWILSLEDSHANPTQLLENKWGKMIPATSGRILSESLGKCDQDSYSLKTFQMSLNSDLTKLSLTSINWGILVHGGIWQLPKLAQDTKETDGSYLEFPTPTTQANAQVKGQYSKTTGTTLAGYVKMFPTPTTKGYGHASEGQTRHFLNMVKENKMTIEEAQSMLNLKEIKNHRTYKNMFPTPTANEGQKAGYYSKGQMGNSLTAMAKQGRLFPTPISRESNEANNSLEIYKKKGREKDTLTRVISGEEGLTHGGRLSPQWVAWLMGLPIGWINSDYSGTE